MLFDDMIADMEDHKKVSPFSYRIDLHKQKLKTVQESHFN